uniref:peptide chain release factor N(5)-glutamine methyltransferase n=1 Tax=uncultured SAR11 cluster bacterium HF0010_09O16 TaxID=710725 RepID=E0XWX2_9PROT|nr:methylase of polypeptide chain release factors [uncultured SAR11 cluster bacterium HF0010_09O16]
MDIKSALKKGQSILIDNNIISAKLDSEILMSQAIRKNKKFIILNLHKEIKKRDLEYFDNLIQERAGRKPIAQIVKKKDFWKYEFIVNNNVLIPRPDTETLIEQTLKLVKNKNRLQILDIGIGSGCILMSILKEKKNFIGTGIDISSKSLQISKVNGQKLRINNRLRLFKSNIDNFNTGKYDLIVSNPPYIKKSILKCLEKDIGFEPKQALDGGLDGLSEIRKVINKSSELIKRSGHLIIEIGFDQKNKVKKILRDKGFYIKKTVKDLSNHDRCIVGIKT